MRNKTMFVAMFASLTVQAWAQDSSSVPVDQVPHFRSTVLHILDAAQNAERAGVQVITLKEQQGIVRIIHRDQLSALELIQIRIGIEKLPQFADLSEDAKVDVSNLTRDLSWVRSKMAEYEMFNRYSCRFSLVNDPTDELKPDSIAKNPSLYRGVVADDVIDRMEKNTTDRTVIGFCWSKAENDPLNLWTQELRKNQFKN